MPLCKCGIHHGLTGPVPCIHQVRDYGNVNYCTMTTQWVCYGGWLKLAETFFSSGSTGVTFGEWKILKQDEDRGDKAQVFKGPIERENFGKETGSLDRRREAFFNRAWEWLVA